MLSPRTLEMRRIAEGADIATAAALAREIWIRHYVPIIGQAQTDYMIAKFQSPEAIARQIAGGYQYYLVIADGEPVGYFALVPGPAEHRALLSKIYEALAEPLAFKRLAGTLALQIRGERRFLHWRASVPASRRVGFAGASYIRQERRGAGLGRAIVAFVEDRCAAMGVRELWLTVNRHNAGSIAFYRRLGFAVTGRLVQDIGGGFVMDDYRMAKRLGPAAGTA